MSEILPNNKEYWSAEELKELEDEWKNSGDYKDVIACHIQDCTATVAKCLSGCNLTINKPKYSDNNGWCVIKNKITCHIKTVFCREHAFARIYVISERNYSRTKDEL